MKVILQEFRQGNLRALDNTEDKYDSTVIIYLSARAAGFASRYRELLHTCALCDFSSLLQLRRCYSAIAFNRETAFVADLDDRIPGCQPRERIIVDALDDTLRPRVVMPTEHSHDFFDSANT